MMYDKIEREALRLLDDLRSESRHVRILPDVADKIASPKQDSITILCRSSTYDELVGGPMAQMTEFVTLTIQIDTLKLRGEGGARELLDEVRSRLLFHRLKNTQPWSFQDLTFDGDRDGLWRHTLRLRIRTYFPDTVC